MADFAVYITDSMSTGPHLAFLWIARVDIDSDDQLSETEGQGKLAHACLIRRALPC